MMKPLQVMLNVLYYYGMCGVVKELLLKRYFSKVLLRFKLIPLGLFVTIFENCFLLSKARRTRKTGETCLVSSLYFSEKYKKQ